MGQPSRKERRLNNAYRDLNLKRRELRQNALQMAQEWKDINTRLQQTMVALLGVLAQQGGEAYVTKGTLDQIIENLPRLGWKTEPKPGEEGTLRILLTEQEQDAQPAPSAETVPVRTSTKVQVPVPDSAGGPLYD